MKLAILILVVTASLFIGCAKQSENSEAVQDKVPAQPISKAIDIKKIGKEALLSWEGKYPTVRGPNVFEELNLKPILRLILTEEIFKKIFTEFTSETPIRIADNHLLISRSMPHAAFLHAMIAISADSGEISVYWYDGKISIFSSKSHVVTTDKILHEFVSTHNLTFREIDP